MAALMLGTVYRQTRRKYQLKLLAGEGGLHRSLRWLYFSEDIGNADFLRGGELMVLTGHSFQSGAEFESFVRMLVRKNSCGVIVNIGKYIFEEGISKELRDFCDAHNFPLITMPWKYHLTDILQDYSQRIFSRIQERERLSYVFQGILKDGRVYTQEDETRLVANRYDLRGDYCAAVISYQNRPHDMQPEDLDREVSVLAENHLNLTRELVCVFPYCSQLVLVFHNRSWQDVTESLARILEVCKRSFPRMDFHGGLGSQMQGVEQVGESYRRALFALRCAGEKGQVAFQDLGIFQLLFTCRDPEILGQFTRILTPLEDYDKQNGSQLAETLELYLERNGSVNQVSDAMFCHRNTTNYRIKKIKALLESDLEDSNLRFQLQMAFCVKRYRSAKA